MPHCHTYINTLRQLGYRITPQREMIIETLAHSGDHMTAERIYEQVQGRTRAVNIATVYRTLDLLVERGLVSRSIRSDGQLAYATGRHGPHIHLTCRQCGQVVDADYRLVSPLAEQLQAQYHFATDIQHLSMTGLCAGCQSKTLSNGG
jgi:Fur family ferric uptake transcriptional regulator